MRRIVQFAYPAIFVSLALSSFSVAQTTVTLNATAIPLVTGWDREAQAQGAIGGCTDCFNGAANGCSATAPGDFSPIGTLVATQFDPWTLPAGRVITEVRVAFNGAFAGSASNTAIFGFTGSSSATPRSLTVSGGCAWRGNIIITQPSGIAWTKPQVDAITLTLRRNSIGAGAPDLFCNAFRIEVTYDVDTDGDGFGNAIDDDDDGDGVLDVNDPQPLNRFICGDSDGDGCDDCSVVGFRTPSNDGPDFDGDGICDAGDPDDDNDGVLDVNDPQPLNRFICGDSDGDGCDDCSVVGFRTPSNDGPDDDGDGICNTRDNCRTSFNPDQADFDGDGIGDVCDPDDDNDGVPDVNDPQPRNRFVCGDSDGDGCDDCAIVGFRSPANDGPDLDGDGLCDAGDPDIDGDGILNVVDRCPRTASSNNNDNDGDGIGDICDPDDDNDGVPDTIDNCPFVANADQVDSDQDGVGNACDNCPSIFNPRNAQGVQPPCDDCNGNGVTDTIDIASGLVSDCNLNGIPDQCEFGGATVNTRLWANPAGGLFSTDSNWCAPKPLGLPQPAPSAPTSTQIARFDVPSTFNVSLGVAPTTTAKLEVARGNLTLDLSVAGIPTDYLISSANQESLLVGDAASSPASLTLRAGSFGRTPLGTSAGPIRIGGSSQGALTLSNATFVRSSDIISIGGQSAGSVVIQAGSRLETSRAGIGSTLGQAGSVVVDGAASTFRTTNAIEVIRGSLSVFNNAVVRTGPQGLTVFPNGILRGNATILASVFCEGTLDPAHPTSSSTGVPLTINGVLDLAVDPNETSSPNGTLRLDVFNFIGNNDLVIVNGLASLAGGLIIPDPVGGLPPLPASEVSVELLRLNGGIDPDARFFDVVSLPPLSDPSRALRVRYVCPGCEGGSGVVLEVGDLGSPISLFPPSPQANTSEPAAVIAAELNIRRGSNPAGDQLSDLVIVESAGPSAVGAVRMLTNRGSDALGNWLGYSGQSPLSTVGINPVAVLNFDIDSDGDEDLFVVNAGSNTISVLRNRTAPGSLTTLFDTAAVLQTGNNPVDVDVGPFASDGRNVVVSLDRDGQSLSFFVSETPFVFRPRITRPTPNPATPRPGNRIRCGDFNSDGRVDLVVLATSESKVWLFRNTTTANDPPGTVRFADAIEYFVGAQPVDLVVAKLRDGRPSVVTANRADNTISVLVNPNRPGVAPVFGLQPPVNIAAGIQPRSISATDLENDGDEDLIVVTDILQQPNPIRARIFRNDFITNQRADQVVLVRGQDIVDTTQPGELKFVVPANLTNTNPPAGFNPDLVAIHSPAGGRGPSGNENGNIRPSLRRAPCPADFDRDGQLTPDDLADFISAYFAGLPSADFDHSGSLDPDDLADYIGAYFAGCR